MATKTSKTTKLMQAIEHAHLGISIASLLLNNDGRMSKTAVSRNLDAVRQILEGITLVTAEHVSGKEVGFSGFATNVAVTSPLDNAKKITKLSSRRKAG